MCPYGGGELSRHLIQCGLGRGLLHAKFHLDPPNRLPTIQQRHRQTERQDRQHSGSIRRTVFGRPFVKRFALCYRSVVCPVCLSVCPVCDVRALWPNSWTDQDETWHAGRPRPWPHSVKWGPISPPPKGGGAPNFRPISVVAKWLHVSRCHFIWRKDLAQATLC